MHYVARCGQTHKLRIVDQGEPKSARYMYTRKSFSSPLSSLFVCFFLCFLLLLTSSHLSPLFLFPLSPLIPQAYYFDDSDDQSVSDINPLIKRPPSQVATCHTHIITGYLSAVEAIVLVRWKLDYSPIPTIIAYYILCA